MSDIHFDTSFLIRSLIEGTRENRILRKWLGEGRSVSISTVGWTEFLCGPVEAEVIELALRVVTDVLPFGHDEAEVAAILFNQTGRCRNSLLDCMIAATAINRNAAVATCNVRDFVRFEDLGLVVESLS